MKNIILLTVSSSRPPPPPYLLLPPPPPTHFLPPTPTAAEAATTAEILSLLAPRSPSPAVAGAGTTRPGKLSSPPTPMVGVGTTSAPPVDGADIMTSAKMMVLFLPPVEEAGTTRPASSPLIPMDVVATTRSATSRLIPMVAVATTSALRGLEGAGITTWRMVPTATKWTLLGSHRRLFVFWISRSTEFCGVWSVWW